MSYSNPKIPEGINVTDEHPLKDFFYMLLGIGLTVIAIIMVLAITAEYLVRFIPFSVEQKLANHFQAELFEASTETSKHQQYLQEMTDRLSVAQQLPKDMTITVHYIDGDEVNAFATLGGHVFIYRGLLEKIKSENALSMVLAHEIAHIKHRDPIIAMGRGVTVSLAMLSLVGAGDSTVAQQVVGQISLLTTLGFNRDMEQEADKEALFTLKNHYGHTKAAEDIFSMFIAEQNGLEIPEFLSTHPQSEDRITAVKGFQKQYRHQINDKITPLPEWLVKP
ncbi:M48 family metallopeptidase [Parendozoicomonas sp. Alg238-R29]|uniref:M48 family metallopeptidase n=1 Tax=Parendozoicomonas sp. Alg238-R29 TaxID=2993446 RepID=UPI00248E0762|nr:M48 family metallopeptidase [Parendozoicomonas sp. Alg238-R29]